MNIYSSGYVEVAWAFGVYLIVQEHRTRYYSPACTEVMR